MNATMADTALGDAGVGSRDLAYPAVTGTRDLRIDYLRGMIMLIVITVHMEYFSVYSYLVWERFGVISSAEGFVTLSGIVMGMVYMRRIREKGFKDVGWKIVDRASLLYRMNITMIVLIFCLNMLPFIDAFTVMNFVDPFTQKVYPLFPSSEASFKVLVKQFLLLRAGPHQFQVIGLYVVLIMLAPLFFWLMASGKTKLLLGLSWLVYAFAWTTPMRITGAQFEYAFPLLTWQLLFVHGLAIGAHKDALLNYFSEGKGRALFSISLIIALGFLFFTLNNPNPALPGWAKISMIDPKTFYEIRSTWFDKSQLGLGRIINNLVLFIVFFGLMTRYWVVFDKALGWLMIPLGQASLYVFIVHVFWVLMFSLTPLPEMKNFWVNTLMHTAAILGIWAMVKNKVLYRWIPS